MTMKSRNLMLVFTTKGYLQIYGRIQICQQLNALSRLAETVSVCVLYLYQCMTFVNRIKFTGMLL